jgi:nondiscriminating glutamyl-tRNA synthetase
LGGDRERLSKRHGATSIANFREMGVLPEALVNYLALLGWAPRGGTRELFSREELVKEFSLERVTPSPAVFDMEKLYWLNRHYIKQAPPERINKLAFAYFSRRITQESAGDAAAQSTENTWSPPAAVSQWLDRVTQLLAPYVDRLEQLPERTSFIFRYDPIAALSDPGNAAVFAWPQTDAVIARFAVRILEQPEAAGQLTPETFKAIVNAVKAETGAKGKELFHPIRIVIMGSHSGPDFDRLIPIIEEGSRLPLPKPVLSVKQRVESFAAARAH